MTTLAEKLAREAAPCACLKSDGELFRCHHCSIRPNIQRMIEKAIGICEEIADRNASGMCHQCEKIRSSIALCLTHGMEETNDGS